MEKSEIMSTTTTSSTVVSPCKVVPSAIKNWPCKRDGLS